VKGEKIMAGKKTPGQQGAEAAKKIADDAMKKAKMDEWNKKQAEAMKKMKQDMDKIPKPK
jgi:polyhydroxyalkanoate synthesis regulator phasin